MELPVLKSPLVLRDDGRRCMRRFARSRCHRRVVSPLRERGRHGDGDAQEGDDSNSSQTANAGSHDEGGDDDGADSAGDAGGKGGDNAADPGAESGGESSRESGEGAGNGGEGGGDSGGG